MQEITELSERLADELAKRACVVHERAADDDAWAVGDKSNTDTDREGDETNDQ